MKILFILLVLMLNLTACNKEDSAKNALLEFINYRFNTEQTKDVLVKKSYGKLRNLLLEMSDDEFKKFANVEKIKKKKINIILENCKEQICFITYTLNYADYESKKMKDEKFAIEVKKIAKLEKIQNLWLVSDINNIKTHIDSKKKVDIEGIK